MSYPSGYTGAIDNSGGESDEEHDPTSAAAMLFATPAVRDIREGYTPGYGSVHGAWGSPQSGSTGFAGQATYSPNGLIPPQAPHAPPIHGKRPRLDAFEHPQSHVPSYDPAYSSQHPYTSSAIPQVYTPSPNQPPYHAGTGDRLHRNQGGTTPLQSVAKQQKQMLVAQASRIAALESKVESIAGLKDDVNALREQLNELEVTKTAAPKSRKANRDAVFNVSIQSRSGHLLNRY